MKVAAEQIRGFLIGGLLAFIAGVPMLAGAQQLTGPPVPAGVYTTTGALKGNGSGTVSQAGASDLSNGVSGSGAVVLVTSPTLVTPTLGAAVATSLAVGNNTSTTPVIFNANAATFGINIENGGAIDFIQSGGSKFQVSGSLFNNSQSSTSFEIVATGTTAGPVFRPNRTATNAGFGASVAGNSTLWASNGTGGAAVNALDCNYGGHCKPGGAAPAVTSCGTSPSIVGTDGAGEVTTGTGTPTACTITFNVAFSAQPYCILEDRTARANLTSYTVSTTAIVVTTSAASSQVIPYHCLGA